MADPNDPRYRASESYDPETEQDGTAAPDERAYDPLEDLARLISGGSLDDRSRGAGSEADDGYDQYQNHGRYDQPEPHQDHDGAQPSAASGGYDYGDGQYDGRYADHDHRGDTLMPQEAVTPQEPEHDGWAERYDQRSSASKASLDYDDGWPQSRAGASQSPAYDPFAAPIHQAPAAGDHHYDPRAYDARQVAGQAPRQTYATQAPSYEADGLHGAAAFQQDEQTEEVEADATADPFDPFLPAGYTEGDARQAAAAGAGALPPFLSPGQQPPDDFYDDAPDEKPRRQTMLIAAIIGLALLGTAGAFGYRMIFSGPSGPPPIIHASTEPTKIDPPQAKEDDSPGIAFNRFGHRGQDEKVVPRQETPVDLSSLVPTGAAASGEGADPSALIGLPPNVLSDPRRVRSVPIRPGQEGGGAPQVVMPSITPQSVASSLPFGSASRGQQQPPADGSSQVATAVSSASPPNVPLDVTPQAQNRPPVPQQAPPAAERRSSGPLSLAPGGAATSSQQPTRLASAPSSGGYAVQVSSRRTEGDAQNAYRALQSRYAGVLGAHPSFIRRADLGDRGVFYRALVGPFGSRAEAVQLCESLKAAGGDCLVQSN